LYKLLRIKNESCVFYGHVCSHDKQMKTDDQKKMSY